MKTLNTNIETVCGLLILLALPSTVLAEAKRPVEGIMDNSFLVEEAYNQEAGVVQHIFNGVHGVDKLFGPEKRSLDLSFTQEWPVFSQTHQFSYTVPYGFVWDGGQEARGVGDVLLNYRYQAYLDEQTLTGFSPRFSLVLPTGEDGNGFGNGTLGYQWNLPFSTTVNDRWFVHVNAGLTFFPDAGEPRARDLLSYNLGGSAIYCVNSRFNLMLEWIGNWSETVGSNGGAERQFASVISPGVRYAFNFKSGSQLVVGLGVPVGLTRTTPEIAALLYISFEHNFFGQRQK